MRKLLERRTSQCRNYLIWALSMKPSWIHEDDRKSRDLPKSSVSNGMGVESPQYFENDGELVWPGYLNQHTGISSRNIIDHKCRTRSQKMFFWLILVVP